jgi:hypothetical protein
LICARIRDVSGVRVNEAGPRLEIQAGIAKSDVPTANLTRLKCRFVSTLSVLEGRAFRNDELRKNAICYGKVTVRGE